MLATLVTTLGALVAGLAVAWIGLPSSAQPPPPAAQVALPDDWGTQAWDFAIEQYHDDQPRLAWTYLMRAEFGVMVSEEARGRLRFRLDGAEVAFFIGRPEDGAQWARLGLSTLLDVPTSVYYLAADRAIDNWTLHTLLAASRALAGDDDGLRELQRIEADPAALTADAAYLRARVLEGMGQVAAARSSYERYLAAGAHRTFLRRAFLARQDAAERIRGLRN